MCGHREIHAMKLPHNIVAAHFFASKLFVKRWRTMRYWPIIPDRTEYAKHLQTMYAGLATSWKRIYRQVFWLADGSRTVERISTLLHKPTERIVQVIGDLLVSGHIKVNIGEKE